MDLFNLKRKRLQQEYDALQTQSNLVLEAVRRLQVDFAIKTDPLVKFELEQQLGRKKEELAKLEAELAALESQLNAKADPNAPTELTDKQRGDFIRQLKKRYADRLAQKLDDRFAIDLEFKYTLHGVDQRQLIRLDDEAKTERDVQLELADLLAKHPYLLILGEPGAGKTSRLLDLALGLLAKAESDAAAPIPVIFNLASWTSDQGTFEKWLADILIQMYGYPKELALLHIRQNRLIPLLDGFDEVGGHLTDAEARQRLRRECLIALHDEYKNQSYSPPSFVICSRMAEYEQAGEGAPVGAQILVKPVTADKARQTLESIKADKKPRPNKNPDCAAADNLLILFDQNPAIRDVLCTPFYFNAALQILNQKNDYKLNFPGEAEPLKNYLVEQYVNRKLCKPHRKYIDLKMRQWLSWLAQWLSQQKTVTFELVHFQPCDLKSIKAFGRITRWMEGLVFGLVFGLLLGIGLSFFAGSLASSFIMLASSFIISVFLGLIFSVFKALFVWTPIFDKDIVTEDIIRWNWEKLGDTDLLKIMLFAGIFAGSIFGLVGGLISVIVGGEFLKGFVYGLLLGLLGSPLTSLYYRIREISYFAVIDKPYRRLTANIMLKPFRFGLFTFTCIFFLSKFYMVPWLKIESQLITSVSLFFALVSGLLSFSDLLSSAALFKHFALNICLWREKSLPFPMASFFDHCVTLRILEKDGGSWRFRHQIIHDYFKNQAVPKE